DTERAGGGAVAVGADQGLARFAEALHVGGMADAVSRTAVPDAEAAAGGTQKEVLFAIQIIRLEEIMVDILGGDADLHALGAHRFKFQHDEHSQHVLWEYLIDTD